MTAGLGVYDEAAQTEIYQVQDVGQLANAHHDIVWFDVAVNVFALMHGLYEHQQLVEQHQGRFQREFASA